MIATRALGKRRQCSPDCEPDVLEKKLIFFTLFEQEKRAFNKRIEWNIKNKMIKELIWPVLLWI